MRRAHPGGRLRGARSINGVARRPGRDANKFRARTARSSARAQALEARGLSSLAPVAALQLTRRALRREASNDRRSGSHSLQGALQSRPPTRRSQARAHFWASPAGTTTRFSAASERAPKVERVVVVWAGPVPRPKHGARRGASSNCRGGGVSPSPSLHLPSPASLLSLAPYLPSPRLASPSPASPRLVGRVVPRCVASPLPSPRPLASSLLASRSSLASPHLFSPPSPIVAEECPETPVDLVWLL